MMKFCFFGPQAITEPWMDRDNWVLLNTTSTFESVMRLTDSRLARSLGT